MSKTIVFILIITTLISLSACDNTLDILDEYDDFPVVYGLLNRNDSAHYVRIQKGFLGSGNALLMAQYPDSIYYDTAKVEIHVYERVNKIARDTMLLRANFGFIKNEGLFTDEKHIVYQLYKQIRESNGSNTYDPYFILKNDADYTLEIKNKVSGKVTTAITTLVESISQLNLFPSTKVNLASEFPFNVKISSAKNGKVYGLIMRLKYREINISSGNGVNKYVDYYLPNLTSINTNGGQILTFLLDGQVIFRYLKEKIKKDPLVSRPIGLVDADYIFNVGSEDLHNYIQVNDPGNTVNYIPEYTNLSNGKGIFTSRWISTAPNIKFNSPTQDSLLNSQFTKGLFN